MTVCNLIEFVAVCDDDDDNTTVTEHKSTMKWIQNRLIFYSGPVFPYLCCLNYPTLIDMHLFVGLCGVPVVEAFQSSLDVTHVNIRCVSHNQPSDKVSGSLPGA